MSTAKDLSYPVLEIVTELMGEGLKFRTMKGAAPPGEFGVPVVRAKLEERGLAGSPPTIRKAIDWALAKIARAENGNVSTLIAKQRVREEVKKEFQGQQIVLSVNVSAELLTNIVEQQQQIVNELQEANKNIRMLLATWK